VADFSPRLPLERDLLSLKLDSSESLLDWDAESLEVLLLLDSLEDDSPEDSPEVSSITSFFFFLLFSFPFSLSSWFSLVSFSFSLTPLDFSWRSWIVLTDPAPAKSYRASGVA
jgi:hypothetical protein